MPTVTLSATPTATTPIGDADDAYCDASDA
jgi:hypothetical protein